jgi:hypothetical protein
MNTLGFLAVSSPNSPFPSFAVRVFLEFGFSWETATNLIHESSDGLDGESSGLSGDGVDHGLMDRIRGR